MKKESYTYPAIFEYSPEGTIEISFCDFPEAITSAEQEVDAIESAKEVLGMTLVDYECLNKEMPQPTGLSMIELKSNQKLVYVEIWMPYFKSKMKQTYSKKTLTIPTWLDLLAKDRNVNFSSLLVQALKKELNIED